MKIITLIALISSIGAIPCLHGAAPEKNHKYASCKRITVNDVEKNIMHIRQELLLLEKCKFERPKEYVPLLQRNEKNIDTWNKWLLKISLPSSGNYTPHIKQLALLADNLRKHISLITQESMRLKEILSLKIENASTLYHTQQEPNLYPFKTWGAWNKTLLSDTQEK